jgi:hypothetical protein
MLKITSETNTSMMVKPAVRPAAPARRAPGARSVEGMHVTCVRMDVTDK